MMLRALVLCTVLLATSACRDSTNPADRSGIAGQYELETVDGQRQLPCCAHTDSAGALVSIGNGILQIDWNTPAGAYEWYFVLNYDYQDGTSEQVQSSFSSGTYTLDGTTLTLVDSSNNLGRMTGSASDHEIVIQAPNHSYGFFRLPQLPH